jgi:hypothetical protein
MFDIAENVTQFWPVSVTEHQVDASLLKKEVPQ